MGCPPFTTGPTHLLTNQSTPTPHPCRVSTSNALAAHLWPILSELMGEETGWLGGDSRVEGKDRCVLYSFGLVVVVCERAWPKTQHNCHNTQPNSLVPLSVIVNYRKQFGLSPSYFGNAVAMRTIPFDEPLTLPGMVRSVCSFAFISRGAHT